MSYLTTDLAMATVSTAKVANVDEVIRNAEIALSNHRLSQENKNHISKALDKLKSTSAAEITDDMASEVDGLISGVSTVTVSENGKAVINVIAGTEGFNLSNKEQWRLSRIEGLESLLDELSKNIKRWANKLNVKLNELFSSNKKAVESLKKRIIELDKYMAELEGNSANESSVIIPPGIEKCLAVNSKTILDKSNIENILNTEVNYIFTVLKNWILETVSYKNKAIRYFGNKASGPLSELYRPHPRFFSKKSFVDENVMTLVYYTPPKGFIGGGGIWFCENTKKPETLKEAAGFFEDSGYNIIQSSDADKQRYIGFMETDVLKFKQLENIYNTISKIIEIMEHLNHKSNDFDLSDRDVKDVLSTVKNLNDPDILDSYGVIFTHYQLDASATQSGFIKYLYNLCDKLISFMFIHLESYEQ